MPTHFFRRTQCDAMLNCLRDRAVVAGGFWKIFQKPSFLMLGSKIRCGIRLVVGGRIAGDQGMFIRRETLSAIGGVPDVELMEDFELSRRLRQVGRSHWPTQLWLLPPGVSEGWAW